MYYNKILKQYVLKKKRKISKKKKRKEKKMKILKRVIKAILLVVLICCVVVGGYIVYITATFSRIADDITLDVSGDSSLSITTNQEYSITTYNIGFGAYGPDYSFFMDTGTLKSDNSKITGVHGRGLSEENVKMHIDSSIEEVKTIDSDFVLLQEIDTDSTRSYHMDQQQMYLDSFTGFDSTFGINYHSAYMALPIFDMTGKSNAGLLSLSKYKISSSSRQSYSIPDGFPDKYMDLDRCFVVNKIKVTDTKDLYIINSHMSAYDDGEARATQLRELNNYMLSLYDDGNYVICGGDFNQDFCESSEQFESTENIPSWLKTFQKDDLNEAFSTIVASNKDTVPTARNACRPYVKGENYTCIIDGFIVSDNITATSKNIDTDFKDSDHNPVVLKFKLI